MNRIVKIAAFLACVFAGTVSFAQTPITFLNTLDTNINLILRNRIDGSESTVAIARGATAPFNIPGGASNFDVRIMPLDNINTGFRFDNRNLVNIASKAAGAAVPLGGITDKVCRCYRTCHRFYHRWATVCKEERVAAFIDEPDGRGGFNRVTAPVAGY